MEPGVCVDRFLDIALSFPTVILSVLLMVAVGYWLLALLGLFDMEVLDLPDVGETSDGGAAAGLLSGLLIRFGLAGLPFALIYTAVIFIAWLACYFVVYFLLQAWGSDALRVLTGIALVPVLLFLALPFAGLMLQPFKRLFTPSEGRLAGSLLGELVTIRSDEVSETRGTAEYNDGAAGLVLQVRSSEPGLLRGDRAVVVEYLATTNVFRVTRSMP